MCDELLKEEEDRQIMSLGDCRIKRVRDNIAFLSMLTVRVLTRVFTIFWWYTE